MPKKLGFLGSELKKLSMSHKVYRKAYKEEERKQKAEQRKKHYKELEKKAKSRAKRKYSKTKTRRAKSFAQKAWDELGRWEVQKPK